MKILVAGATGYLGRFVVKALVEGGHEVRALVRNPRGLERASEQDLAPDVSGLCHDVFAGSATDAATLAGLCDGCDVAFSSLGKRNFSRKPSVWQVDHQANLNILQEAVRANVPHFVFVSAARGEDLRTRRLALARARERVVDALRDCNSLSWTVLRPSAFFNDAAQMFAMCARGTGWLIGNGSMKLNPIHGADLAQAVVRACVEPEWRNRTWTLGGPDVMTVRELYELAFAALQRPARIRSVPAWIVRALAVVTSPFNPMAADLMRTLAVASRMDLSGEPTGTHHLYDLFAELAGSTVVVGSG